MTEQKIEVGQIWRRRKNRRLIRIVGPANAFIGVQDSWRWEGVNYRGRGVSDGGYIRRDCELVEVEDTMTEQSTPTPLEELVAMQLTSEFFIASDGHGSVGIRTDEEAAAIVVAAGWKSPAEVADLVRAAEHRGFARATQHTLHIVSEITANYRKSTTDTTKANYELGAED